MQSLTQDEQQIKRTFTGTIPLLRKRPFSVLQNHVLDDIRQFHDGSILLQLVGVHLLQKTSIQNTRRHRDRQQPRVPNIAV